MRILLSLIFVISLSIGCGTAESAPTVAAARHAESAEHVAVAIGGCRPLLSGCGCAYQCARGTRDLGNTQWEVMPSGEDARLVSATPGRACFDAQGVGYHAEVAPASATRCIDVYYETAVCGGECIPLTTFLGCHNVEERCEP